MKETELEDALAEVRKCVSRHFYNKMGKVLQPNLKIVLLQSTEEVLVDLKRTEDTPAQIRDTLVSSLIRKIDNAFTYNAGNSIIDIQTSCLRDPHHPWITICVAWVYLGNIVAEDQAPDASNA